MRIQLPDINVLIAMHDSNHAHHQRASDWFADEGRHGWATCPLTENGFIRILAQTSIAERQPTPFAGFALLDQTIAAHAATHHFWEDRVSLRDETLFRRAAIAGHNQITDVYLLGLCQSYGATFVTLDTRVSVAALAAPPTDLLRVLL